MLTIKIYPDDIVAELKALASADTDPRWAKTKLLLIDVTDADELLSALIESSTLDGIPLTPSRDGLGFMTAETQVMGGPNAKGPVAPMTDMGVLGRLSRGAHFIAPVRKRQVDSKSWIERVNVGRARNNDVVLRQKSVSKLHAWFESDENGQLWLTDAGSTNRTRVGSQVLEPNVAQPVANGSEIHFGTVKCLLCQTQLVRNALVHLG